MKNLVCSIGLSAAAMAFFACSGDDVTKVYETNNTTVGMDLVAEGDDLPECDADHEGRLIFVADSSMAYYCSADKEWLPFGGDNCFVQRVTAALEIVIADRVDFFADFL